MSKFEKFILYISLLVFLISDIFFIVKHFRDIPVLVLFTDFRGALIPIISAIIWISILYRYAKKKKEEKGD